MKMILTGLVAVTLVGCVSQAPVAGRKGDLGGLTKAQWQEYDNQAAAAVANPAAWRSVGARRPKGVRVSSRSPLFTTSNSSDGVQPPTKVTVGVPIQSLPDNSNAVVVEFAHPGGKIAAMAATQANVD